MTGRGRGRKDNFAIRLCFGKNGINIYCFIAVSKISVGVRTEPIFRNNKLFCLCPVLKRQEQRISVLFEILITQMPVCLTICLSRI